MSLEILEHPGARLTSRHDSLWEDFRSRGDWYGANTLRERIVARDAGAEVAASEVDRELANLRLGDWEESMSNDNARLPAGVELEGPFFERWLSLQGLSREEFIEILGEENPSEEASNAAAPPSWLPGFLAALATDPAPKARYAPETFLDVLAPLVEFARQRFCEAVEDLVEGISEAPFEAETVVMHFLPDLQAGLVRLASPTLVLELNVARLEERISGTSPQERFLRFLEYLGEPENLVELFMEYPVLARLLDARVEQWSMAGLEILERLLADRKLLREELNGGAGLGHLTHVALGQGDRHRGGRTVARLELSSGFEVIYKPHSMAIDQGFNELLEWLGARGLEPGLRTFKALDRGAYGWAEVVSADPCHSEDEVERFYRRQGSFLAILHALNGSDMHFENLIASGEHPVLVDCETVMHTRRWRESLSVERKPVLEMLTGSVLMIGMLPSRFAIGEDYEGIDLGGLSSEPGQKTMVKARVWDGEGTDEMHAAYRRLTMPGAKNLPMLNGERVGAMAYRGTVIAGFRDAYALLVKNREALCAEDGPIARMADSEIRFLLRPTRSYTVLLNKSYHPDFLRDARDRDALFHRLWTASADDDPVFALLPYEIAELHDDLVPLYATRPGSRDLWTSRGQRIPSFFASSALEQIRSKIAAFGERDLDRQVWLIEASFGNLLSDPENLPSRGAPAIVAVEPEVSAAEMPGRQDFLDAALRIGQRLEDLAVVGDDAMWLGLNRVPTQRGTSVVLGSAAFDLYNGLPGIALFLAYLGQQTGEARFTDLARRAWRAVDDLIRFFTGEEEAPESFFAEDDGFDHLGAFNGWAGAAYVAAHLDHLWRDREWQDPRPAVAIPRILDEVERRGLIEKDGLLDVLGGSAGCGVALLAARSMVPEARLLELAQRCGNHLVRAARPQEQGLGWPRHNGTSPALTGFAHGAAGMSWSLLRLAEVTGDTEFRDTALAGLSFERHLFDPMEGNWPDLRTTPGAASARHFFSAWCHGAPGIVLGRAGALDLLDDATTRQEIEDGLATTLVSGFGRNHSLCHGDLGNLEAFLVARRAMPDPRWDAAVATVSRRVLGDLERRGPACGIDLDVDIPGFMTGLSGIGYGLLRLASPEQVPSVLLLEAPTVREPVS